MISELFPTTININELYKLNAYLSREMMPYNN